MRKRIKESEIINKMVFRDEVWQITGFKSLKDYEDFIRAEERRRVVGEIEKAYFETMYGFSNKTWDKCFKNKLSVDGVSEKNWQDSSFTFEEAWEKIEQKLKSLKEK